MQAYALTVDKFLDHAAKWFPTTEVVDVDAGHVRRRITYAALRERANSLSGALIALGCQPGDRVATLAWNSQHHLETYYAVMGLGFVCHTLNPRLTVAHLATMIGEAEDRVIAVAADLLPLWRELAPLCPSIAHVIVLDEPAASQPAEGGAAIWNHDALIAERGRAVAWGEMDEHALAGLCYTSGTTGAPKGVPYTHRSNYLHTLRCLQADAVALTAQDVLLLGVPMFHANGWGMPFAAPAAGTKLVLPGRALDGANLAQIVNEERVTVAVGVQTLWLGLADHVEASGSGVPSLQRVLIGGSSCPEALLRRIENVLDLRAQPSWGMTELSPLGTIAPAHGPRPPAGTAGRPPIGVDLKLTDAVGATLPQQRGVEGRLHVRGQSVVERYYGADADALEAEGFFDTGDLATIDEAGNLTINGRAKDLIKSGGEWINPSEIEAIVGRHPAVRHVAVVGRADAKWGERPILIVEAAHPLDPRDLLAAMHGQVADWWLPQEVAFVDAMPLAATGKIDKMRLRADVAAGRVTGMSVPRASAA